MVCLFDTQEFYFGSSLLYANNTMPYLFSMYILCLSRSLFIDSLFPIDIAAVAKDHDFLDQDSIEALFR